MSTTTTTMTPARPTVPSVPKIRGYKDFLTPSLHRKFTRAAGVALLGCYVEAILIGDKSSYFWSWFPLGRTGIRTSLLFITILLLFILRVSNLKFGQRTAVSPIAQFVYLAKSFTLLRTAAFYIVSAWWYSEIYVWSADEDADLSWVKPDDENGRDRLNERPIFLRSNMALLALVMAGIHLHEDFDQIKITPYPSLEGHSSKAVQKSANQMIAAELYDRLRSAGKIAGSVTLMNFVLYAVIFRRIAWTWSLWFGRLVWDVPRSSEPSTIPPYHYTLIFRAFTSSMLLASLWEISNMAFSAWVCQPPVKHGRPLTTESRDPNGSLINGLRSKKTLTQTSAFWELSIISSSFEDRRRTIFSEIDRHGGGSTWKQVLSSCLAIIESMNIRLEDNRISPPELTLAVSSNKDVRQLPRLSAPLRTDQILQAAPQAKTRTEWAESEIGALTKSIGQGNGQTSRAIGDSPARKFLEKARNQLTPEQRKTLQPEQLVSSVQSFTAQAIGTRFGSPFRQPFASRIQAKVFGSPRSELPTILFAIYSVSQLAVAGIVEDTMGTVNQDIPLIMRTFGNVIGRIQKFVRESQVHWTDVDFTNKGETAKRVEEVEFLVGYLKQALQHIIKGYEEYARDMGISPSELRAARIAAGLDAV